MDNGNNGQSVQMMQFGGQPLTPEQKKTMEQQLQQQQKAAQESMVKLQQNIDQLMDGVKQLYQQQREIMKIEGYPPVFPSFGLSPQNKAVAVPPVPAASKPVSTN